MVPSQRLPPLVIAEALQDFVSNRYKIRRLHLIVVKAVTDQMKHLTNTPEMQRQIPMMPPSGKVPPRCRRFIYGYALGHLSFRATLRNLQVTGTKPCFPAPKIRSLFSASGAFPFARTFKHMVNSWLSLYQKIHKTVRPPQRLLLIQTQLNSKEKRSTPFAFNLCI